MVDVVVCGAAGRMGAEVVRAVTEADGMRVVAGVDPGSGSDTLPDGLGGVIPCYPSLTAALDACEPDVMVDFTRPDAVLANVNTAVSAGVDCVVGTTGVQVREYEKALEGAPPGTSVFVAPNFAIGAVLMMDFAKRAARYMSKVEIIELHHDKKLDAPSGTSLRTAALISEARNGEAPDASEEESLPGARGASSDGVRIHSVRLPGLVAHQEVVFGGVGQTLTIRHDSIDRTSFMPGVVLAIRASESLTGLVVGLENILEL